MGRITNEEFREKFAVDDWNGNFKLTAHGCFLRHNTPRAAQALTKMENFRGTYFSGSRGVMRDERRLLGRVAYLKSRGYRVRPDHQSLEDFCEEYKDIQ